MEPEIYGSLSPEAVRLVEDLGEMCDRFVFRLHVHRQRLPEVFQVVRVVQLRDACRDEHGENGDEEITALS